MFAKGKTLKILGSYSMRNFGRSRIKKGFISGRGDFFCHIARKDKCQRTEGIAESLGRVGWQG